MEKIGCAVGIFFILLWLVAQCGSCDHYDYEYSPEDWTPSTSTTTNHKGTDEGDRWYSHYGDTAWENEQHRKAKESHKQWVEMMWAMGEYEREHGIENNDDYSSEYDEEDDYSYDSPKESTKESEPQPTYHRHPKTGYRVEDGKW